MSARTSPTRSTSRSTGTRTRPSARPSTTPTAGRQRAAPARQLPGAPPSGADVWGPFSQLVERLRGRGPAAALLDARVAALHPGVSHALARAGVPTVRLRAGESVKSARALERVARRLVDLPRRATLLAIGGGTVGDLATVVAHLHKRGVELIQVPTTLLAAVDSSVGGKGALNVGGAKNVVGVFHFAREGWLCPELFTTLSEPQRREGRLEAWKMAVTLHAPTFEAWRRAPPEDEALVRRARSLKEAVVGEDPFELAGRRVVLNFGHTLAHVIEGVTRFRVRHGEAVGLGMLCALDVGVRLGVTPKDVAERVEGALPNGPAPRQRLARALVGARWGEIDALLRVDKKGAGAMVLLERPGAWSLHDVPARLLRELSRRWARAD